jgi:3-hydroxybutyryl-CoA dehydrogenase
MIFRSTFRFSTVRSFGVVGAGQMGTGIAIVANHVAKLPVTIYDSNSVSIRKSREFVESWLKKEQDKNRITPEQIS